MKKTKLLIIALLATMASYAQAKRDSAEKRLILNLSELEVAQLQAQLDNAKYLTDNSNLAHQKAKAIMDICDELQAKIEATKRQQWPLDLPKNKADTSKATPKK
ncbi:MAG: hypothetical protein BGO55_00540 [Sphingobacteriales bacterium 50-39]|nr:hypothetical protein [Sphingobacteriales bacterium]OJW53602.1 MAG: hypothetical protein BGO55_00540 [Sphingobacteriales bacterium 50-39]